MAFSHDSLRSLLYFFVLLFGNLRFIFAFPLSMLVLLPKEMVRLRGKDFLFISLVAPKDGVCTVSERRVITEQLQTTAYVLRDQRPMDSPRRRMPH